VIRAHWVAELVVSGWWRVVARAWIGRCALWLSLNVSHAALLGPCGCLVRIGVDVSDYWGGRFGGNWSVRSIAGLGGGVGSLWVVGVRDVRVVSWGAADVGEAFEDFLGGHV